VFDNDRPVALDDIGAAAESVSIAILIDTSGSMALGPRLADARQAVGMLLDQYKPIDEAPS
jgi:Mg-chelatase subunit ChlD